MRFGIDRLVLSSQLLARLRGARVGVLSHAAAVDDRLRELRDVLVELGIHPVLLFGPEHGYAAAAQDMAGVGDALDPRTGARVVSLYGDALEDLVPSPPDLEGLDVLVVDLCDVGSRHYTFVWSALLATRQAAKCGVHTLVLDRPNPLGGLSETVEGRQQRQGFHSFVGWEAVPIRHGLSLGEMVALFAGDDGLALGPDGALSVVAVEGWEARAPFPAWNRHFVPPSPNMPSYETVRVYPGACLVEGTNLSEGRGQTRPFEICGAPWLDGWRLARDLTSLELGGFIARPVTFMPTFQKHRGEHCQGIHVHVTDSARFRAVAVYTALITLAHHQDPERFRFRTERYEFVDDIPAFDLLTGSAEARQAIDQGGHPQEVAALVSTPDPGWAERMQRATEAVSLAAV
jgi:uncharacterized protein YbbC (DUF1343 family)